MNKKIKIGILTGVLIVSTGCSTLDRMGHNKTPLTDETQRSSVSEGLAIGATIGLGTALAVSTSGASLAYSALIGTGFFGYIGLTNDENVEKTRKYLEQQGITVEDKFDKVVVSFKEDVTFDLQKTKLKENFKPTLDGVAKVLNKLDGKAKFEIIGHADYTGGDKLNQALSNERARIITEYLLEKKVNPENFIGYYGVSSTEPKNYCLELSCLRRMELVIYKDSLLTKIK